MLLPRPRTMSRALFHAHFLKFTGSFNPCSTPQTIPTRLFLQHRSTSPLPWGSLQQFQTYTHGHKHTHTAQNGYRSRSSLFSSSQLSFPGATTNIRVFRVRRNVVPFCGMFRGHSLPQKQVPRGQSVTRTLAATTSTDGDKPQQYPKPIFSVLCNFCTHTPGAWFYGGVQRRSLLEEKNTLRTSNCSLCTELETAARQAPTDDQSTRSACSCFLTARFSMAFRGSERFERI